MKPNYILRSVTGGFLTDMRHDQAASASIEWVKAVTFNETQGGTSGFQTFPMASVVLQGPK